MVRTTCFHWQDPGSVPGWGTEILQTVRHSWEENKRTLSCSPGHYDREHDEVVLSRCQKHWWTFCLAVSRCQNTELPACWYLQGVPQRNSGCLYRDRQPVFSFFVVVVVQVVKKKWPLS